MPMTKKTNKHETFWTGKMSVDEIITLFEWKLIYAEFPIPILLETDEGNFLKLKIDQNDHALRYYLSQLPRDMMLQVKYDEDELTFLI